MKRPRAGYVQQISVPLTPLSNLSTLYLLKSLVLMPGARCRKVGPAAERGKAAAFGYKATVLLVSASKRFRGGVRPCKGGTDCGKSQTASFVPNHCPSCLRNKNKIKAEAGDGLRFCEINRK